MRAPDRDPTTQKPPDTDESDAERAACAAARQAQWERASRLAGALNSGTGDLGARHDEYFVQASEPTNCLGGAF